MRKKKKLHAQQYMSLFLLQTRYSVLENNQRACFREGVKGEKVPRERRGGKTQGRDGREREGENTREMEGSIGKARRIGKRNGLKALG